MRRQDLSLLTNLTQEDIQRLQSVGKDARDSRKQFILKDDTEQAWKCVSGLKGGRIDFVLDNCKCFLR